MLPVSVHIMSMSLSKECELSIAVYYIVLEISFNYY